MEITKIKNCTLIYGDCFEVLKTLQEQSITLVHTDPPYLIHTTEQTNNKMFIEKGINKQLKKLNRAEISSGFDVDKLFNEFKRLCPHVNYQLWCSKKQFIDYLMRAKSNRWNWQDIGLFRNNALPNVRGKYQDKDYCVHLWKGRTLTGTYHNKKSDYHWNIGGKKEWNHPTLKPLEPIINLIEVGSSEGDTVLDPFMGSGTTGIACIRTNRNFIGIENDKNFYEMAIKRIEEEVNS